MPSVFDAVTSTRSVCASSAATAVYVDFVAPVMSPHAVPSVAQRRHWYANVVGFPDHVPFEAVSVLPSLAVPLMVGGFVFDGSRRRPPERGGAYHACGDADRRESDSATPPDPPQIHSSLLPSGQEIASRFNVPARKNLIPKCRRV